MAGLVDQHQLVGDTLALSIARDVADYFLDRIDAVLRAKGYAHWQVPGCCSAAVRSTVFHSVSRLLIIPRFLQAILETEFGGMSETLTVLSTITGHPSYLRRGTLLKDGSHLVKAGAEAAGRTAGLRNSLTRMTSSCHWLLAMTS